MKKVGIEQKQENKMEWLCNSDSLIILILYLLITNE